MRPRRAGFKIPLQNLPTALVHRRAAFGPRLMATMTGTRAGRRNYELEGAIACLGAAQRFLHKAAAIRDLRAAIEQLRSTYRARRSPLISAQKKGRAREKGAAHSLELSCQRTTSASTSESLTCSQHSNALLRELPVTIHCFEPLHVAFSHAPVCAHLTGGRHEKSLTGVRGITGDR